MNIKTFSRAGTVTLLALGLLSGCSLLDSARPSEDSLKAQGTSALSGSQTRSLLNHARYRWEGANGARGNGVTFGDGNLRIFWETGAVNGKIRFTATGYCSRFKGVRHNAEDCYRLYPDGPRQYKVFREDGHYSGQITLIQTR
ncbi:MAG: hypothetical protein Q4D91_14950 [Lautropia sp.]|nr:hypothetical protein [Lautropia sp.]